MKCGHLLARSCPVCRTEAPPTAAFCSHCGASFEIVQPSAQGITVGGRSIRPRSDVVSERKYISILFADVCESSASLVGLDPEEARELIEPAVFAMTDAVRSHGGTVAKTMGDGIMALFGAPVAQEDHPVLASRAALSMTSRDLAQLRIRVGIHCGEVVLTRVGAEPHASYDAIGEAVYLAARLEQNAPPGRVYLSEEARRRAGELIVVESVGAIEMKGFAAPVEAFRLVGMVRADDVGRSRWPRSPFVGRARELKILGSVLDDARQGYGQLVSLIGEAGVGKSRLAFRMIERAREAGWTTVVAAVSESRRSIADAAVAQILRSILGIDHSASADTAQDRVLAWLKAHTLPLDPLAESVLWLLGLGAADGVGEAGAQGPALRTQATRAFLSVVLGAGKDAPLLVLVENAQWLDSSSRSMLEELLAEISGRPMIVVTTSRPGPDGMLANRGSDLRSLLVPSLTDADVDELLSLHLGASPSLGQVKDLIRKRTGNNPFFIEELISSLVEAGDLEGPVGARIARRAVESVRVPATISTVVGARFDRLAPQQKQVLQTLAVLDQPATFGLIEPFVPIGADQIKSTLASLRDAGFIVEDGDPDETTFAVSHAIIGAVIYQRLLKHDRRRLHAIAYDALLARATGRSNVHCRVLGHHAMESERFAAASSHFVEAGKQAYQRSAHVEARDLLQSAVEAADRVAKDREPTSIAIDVRLDLRDGLFALGEIDAIEPVLLQALDLAQTLVDRRRLGGIHALMIHHNLSVGNHAEALASAERALEFAQRSGDGPLVLDARFYRVQIFASLGQYLEAAAEAAEVMAGLETVGGADQRRSTMLSLTRMWRLWCDAELGRFEDAAPYLVAAQEVGAHAAGQATPFDVAIAGLGCGLFWLRHGLSDPQSCTIAIETLQTALHIARSHKFDAWVPAIASPLGCALTMVGRAQEALPLLHEAVDHTSSRQGSGNALRVCHLARAHLAVGDDAEAERLCEKALALARRSGEAGHEAYALETCARVAEAAGDQLRAADLLHMAARQAAGLGMQPLLAVCQAAHLPSAAKT